MLMNKAGLIVIVSLIPPPASLRGGERAQSITGHDYFRGIYIGAPIDVCESICLKDFFYDAISVGFHLLRILALPINHLWPLIWF